MAIRKITLRLLKKLGACDAQKEEFQRVFPNGAYITLKNIRKADNHDLNIGWLAYKLLKAQGRKHDNREEKIDNAYFRGEYGSREWQDLLDQEFLRALKEDQKELK